MDNVIRMTYEASLSHPDDLSNGSISSRWLMVNGLCHPDDLRCYPKSSGGNNEIWTISHPDDLAVGSISSGWLVLWRLDGIQNFPKSSRWHNVFWTLSHPDDLAAIGSISSEWLMDTAVFHPDDLRYWPMSSGWDNYFDSQVIWMT